MLAAFRISRYTWLTKCPDQSLPCLYEFYYTRFFGFYNDAKVSKEDIAWLKWKKALEGHGVTVRKEEEEFQSTIYNLGGF